MCVLLHAKPKLRTSILKLADPDLIRGVAEIALNILKGNIKISKSCKTKLAAHKNLLRRLTSIKGKNDNKRRRFLIQRGGTLVPLIISTLLSSAIGHFLKS